MHQELFTTKEKYIFLERKFDELNRVLEEQRYIKKVRILNSIYNMRQKRTSNNPIYKSIPVKKLTTPTKPLRPIFQLMMTQSYIYMLRQYVKQQIQMVGQYLFGLKCTKTK